MDVVVMIFAFIGALVPLVGLGMLVHLVYQTNKSVHHLELKIVEMNREMTNIKKEMISSSAIEKKS
ncbi:hypothetical protein IC620_14615 [Hazenella sp. IB182357]|uniref:Uncharacterized protein n=1 Tax=Polycladospora coralii TaxID=2771432 RepID=A0A926NHW2_9BACL|nr:hypothetical protein [Polycladospora coralii]MBD1373578.1 hypothetical protein [Polycladospora coralii]MBS7531949.1 hypothetical protein [Polycladospora coralii]